MNAVLACIDGGAQTAGVCDYASWAALRLAAPLRFLHVLGRSPEATLVHDLSSNVGLEAQETLLAELTQLGEAREESARRQAQEILDEACRRAAAQGVANAESLQIQGQFIETLLQQQSQTRLVVLGQHPVPGSVPRLRLDHNVERAVRNLTRPVLVTTTTFRMPSRVAIAFDGSTTGRKLIETLAASPFLRGLDCMVLTAGQEHDAIVEQQQWALDTLTAAGFTAEARHQTGNADAVILDQIDRQRADMLIMGAYGHSRIRELIVGSTTAALLRTSPVPVLILR
ncbi:MAG: universal stress protein [Pigmentiphaga sp.]|nr:universal stress protein [Pigmentiphaga sp.]